VKSIVESIKQHFSWMQNLIILVHRLGRDGKLDIITYLDAFCILVIVMVIVIGIVIVIVIVIVRDGTSYLLIRVRVKVS
jgi:hypothetical protein